MRALLLLVLLVLPFEAWAAPTAAFTARTIQGFNTDHGTCVAPCAVHFDAIGKGFYSTVPYVTEETTDPDVTDPFSDLIYVWDFGDPSSGNWTYSPQDTAQSRNVGYGPIVGHVYESADTFTVRLTVTNHQGESSAVEHTVEVLDADTEFTDDETYCFANTADTFEGCPLDDDGDGTCEQSESSATAFDNCTVTSSYLTAITGGNDCANKSDGTSGGDCANADVASRRHILFARDDTFTVTSTPMADATLGPNLIEAFGNGSVKPTFTGSVNSGGSDNSASGWTFSNLRVTSGEAFSGRCGPPGGACVDGDAPKNITYHESDAVYATGSHICIWAIPDTGDHEPPSLMAFSDVTCTGNATSSGTIVWPGGRYFLIMGLYVDKNGSTAGDAYTMRSETLQHSYFGHAKFIEPETDNWQFRTTEEMDSSIDGDYESNQYVVFSDNISQQPATATGTSLRVCADSNCGCASFPTTVAPTECNSGVTVAAGDPNMGEVADVHHWLIERNLFQFDSGGSGNRYWVIQIPGGDHTIRYNMVDFQDSCANADTTAFVWAEGDPISASDGGSARSTNIYVYNNTLVCTRSSWTGTLKSSYSANDGDMSGCTSGCLDRNNLCRSSGGTTCQADGFTQLTAVADTTGADPFEGTWPAAFSSDFGDIVPSVGESIIDSGTNSSPIFPLQDALGFCRTPPIDIGAIQTGASACSSELVRYRRKATGSSFNGVLLR